MKRVVKIGDINLDKSIFVSTEFDVDDYIGEREIAIDGSSVMFVQAKGAYSQEVKIYSKDSGWQQKATRDAIFALDLLSTITITYNDNTTEDFIFDNSKVPIVMNPLYAGALWYNIEINLLKG